MSPRQKALLKEARRVTEAAKSRALVEAGSQTSQQPRFIPQGDEYFMSLAKWMKSAFETIPEYSNESRKRSKWLSEFWPQEPYLSGLINSVVQIDRNRGWTLVGGRNQVIRFTNVLHNWQVQPGRASWRDGIGAASLAFYTTDIGGLVEVGRQFKDGPMASMYHLDPTRCLLTPNIEAPLKYWPARPGRNGPRVIEFAPQDYMRTTSEINVDENFNGLGYSALSRCVELAITMMAVYRHEQEMLFARAPKGLLLLKGVTQQTWNNAMAVRDATLENREQEWFGSVAVLATSGMDDVDAKLVALSQLPAGFDQKLFTDLLIYGYSLCFGYDPREFWPVSSGALGTATETEAQHRKATGKGGKEFALAFQEELQGNLPDTLHFEFKERDVDGEMADAQLALAQAQVVMTLYGANNPDPVITKEQALEWLAEQGVIPREWTAVEEDVESDDTETVRQRMIEYPAVQRAVQTFPTELLVMYEYPSGKIRELSPRNGRTVQSVAKIMQQLARNIEEQDMEIIRPVTKIETITHMGR
jgi:hypothetical protein